MSPQQIADDLLAEHQAARMRLAVTRSEALYNYWLAERRSGVDALTAHERMAAHAKYLDSRAPFEVDQDAVAQIMSES